MVASRSMGAKEPRTCSHCSESFLAYKRKETNRYCSPDCASRARRKIDVASTTHRRRIAAAYPDPKLQALLNRLRPGTGGAFFFGGGARWSG